MRARPWTLAGDHDPHHGAHGGLGAGIFLRERRERGRHRDRPAGTAREDRKAVRRRAGALGPAEIEALVREAEGMPGRLVGLAHAMAGRQRLLFPPLSEPLATA